MKAELIKDASKRNGLWSESVAMGSEPFIEDIQQQLGWRARGRSIHPNDGGTVLKEPQNPYNALFTGKKDGLRHNNRYFLSINDDLSVD